MPTWLLLIAPVALLFLAGCTAMMDNQPKLEPYEASAFFPDGLSARPVLENTVHRNAIVEPAWFNSGMQNGEPLQEVPAELVNRPSLERGQAQYDIYCSPCHGLDGYGEGMIVQRGFPPPPSLHEQRLREAPAGHYFDVISNGFGVMYGYAGRVTPADRWAIIVYIRALQLSQNAPVDDLPPEDAGRLQQGDDNE